MAVAGRTHRPVIDHGRCTTCSICLGACPAEIIPEMAREEKSLRGSIYRSRDRERVSMPHEIAKSPLCQLACPLHQDVRGYMEHIAAGRHKEALELIRETNPLPSVCGHVCHRPCEEACMRGLFDEALGIRKLKRFVTHYNAGMTDFPKRVEPRRGKVGIIGAGPAGLTAAHDLAVNGCAVEMIESFDEPGGMLAWAIPEFRLPRKILRRDIAYIRNMGVRIRTGLYFGRDVTLSDLKEEGVEALIVATGTQRGLSIHSEEEDASAGQPVRRHRPGLNSVGSAGDPVQQHEQVGEEAEEMQQAPDARRQRAPDVE
ncbi:MAG: FAD-dependent oxidoreductase, partial [Desulfobacteraceae bacterium]|nr:FAD-dependent oxidoreductase [Desulfobacteraceae bacterium]